MPIIAMPMPSSVAKIALRSDRPPMEATMVSAKSMRAKYSGGPNRRAISTSAGASSISIKVAKVPPTKEPMIAAISAVPARPLRASGCPSKVVTADDEQPGVLTRIAVVAPPYIAP